MRFRVTLTGLIVTGLTFGVPSPALGASGPLAGHEPLCHQAHGSTAPPDADRALHERVPRPAMDRVCDPHSGHGHDS